MKRNVRWIAALLIAAVVLFLLALPKLRPENGNPQAGPARPGAGPAAGGGPLSVSANVVQPARFGDRLLATGSVLPNEQVSLQSEVSGKIVRIFFEEGRRVQKGALLVKINDAELQAGLRRAEQRRSLAAEREARQKQLLSRGGISQEEYDETLSELRVLQAEVELIEAQIARTEIHAPFDGVIGLRQVSEGAFITPSTPIATLQNLDQVKVEFSLPEKYVTRVRPGQEVGFTVEGLEERFTGRIYAIEPRIQADTRSLQIRAVSANRGNRLIPGAFARIELGLGEQEDALLIPTIALVPDLKVNRVFVYKSGRAETRDVTTGVRTSDAIQITSGIAPGDTVITSGVQQLRPGAPVAIRQLD